MAQQSKAYTEEEIKKYKELILESLKSGLPLRRMVAQFDVSMYYIKKFRNELIEEGAITKEEVEEAYNEYMKEHPAARGLDGSKTRKPRSNEKSKEREAKALENKEKVFVILKNGKSIAETAQELQMADTSVTRISKVLIEEGRLKESEIKKQTASERIGLAGREEEGFFEKRDKVVELLRLGLKPGSIRTRLNISSYEYALCRRDIRHKNLITSEEIQEARKNREQKDLEYVVDSIKKGFSLGEIEESNSDFVSNEVGKIVAKAIQLGLITRNQVEENRKSATKRKMNLNVKLSPEEQLQFIIDKVIKGYTPKEIAESDKTKSISYYNALYQKRQIIAKGIISQEEAKKAMMERSKKKSLEDNEDIIEKVKEYVRQGYNLKEIAEFLSYKYSNLTRIKLEYEKSHGWFSKEELKEFTRQRKAREEKERLDSLSDEEKARIENERVQEKLIKQQEAEKRRQERKKETEQIHRKHIEQIKMLRKERKTLKQISVEIGFSESYVSELIRESKDDGTWFEEPQEEKKQKFMEELKAHIKSGKSVAETAKAMHCTSAWIYYKLREYRKNGVWLTEEEIRAIEEKKQKNRELARKSKTSNKDRQKNFIEKIDTIKQLYKEHNSFSRIAEIMEISYSYTSRLVSRAKKEGIWFTEEELHEIEREKQEERDRRKQEKLKKDQELKLEKTMRSEAEKQKRERQSKENYKRLIQQIKAHIKNGESIKETAQAVNCSTQHIYAIRRACIANGTWFTEEELKQIEEQKKTSQIQERKRVNAQAKNDREEEIKRLKKEGKTIKQISEEIGLSTTRIYVLIKKSKANGTWITDEELQEIKEKKAKDKELIKAQIKKEKEDKKREKEEAAEQLFREQIEEIKRLYAEGKSQKEIAEETGIHQTTVSKLIKESIANGTWFTDEEQQEIIKEKLRESEEKKKKSEKINEERIKTIKRLRGEGKTTKQISKEIGLSSSYIDTLIRKARENGTWLEDGEVEILPGKAKIENHIEEIKALYIEGYMFTEISKKLNTTSAYVSRLVKVSKADGTWFTDKELEEIKLKRKALRKANKEAKTELTEEDQSAIKQIRSMMLECRTIKEICEEFHYSQSEFIRLRNLAISKGLWFSKEELDEINTRRDKVHCGKNKRVVKKEKELGKEKFVQEIIAQRRSGKRLEDIALTMECSVAHIQKIRKQCIENGTWLSKEEESEIRKKAIAGRKREISSTPKDMDSSKEKK